MLKKTIEYTDYDGNKRVEDFWFDIDEREITKKNYSVKGGLKKLVENITKTQDNEKLINLFEEIIQMAYGVKSADGRRFIKNKEVLEDFIQTPAYTKLYMELLSDAKKASDFINGIIPANPNYGSDSPMIEDSKIIDMPNN